MPFSWKKKTRCNRFSQLVADHLQSPKRGGSLVVETGFPTSLIDLYVRNRGRFRKSSAKKQSENDLQTSLSTSSDFTVNPDNFSSDVSDSVSDEIVSVNDEIMEEDIVVSEDRVTEIENPTKLEVKKRDEMVKLNPVLVVALKVLFMLVLALGTKKFTVGITLSAFFLFFLESVVKPLFWRSSSIKPSVDSETVTESGSHETKDMEKSKENTTVVVCSEVVEIEEEEVELKEEEVRSEKELDEVRSDVSMEIRRKTSRRAILKSRMKRLVPKKLHKSSIGSKGEVFCGIKEEETVKCGQDLKPLLMCTESLDSKGETLCVLKQEQENIVEIEGRCSSSSLTLSSEIECSDRDLGRGSQQNSGYLVLCLIVLIGLIGGRILALVLALSWCFMLKKSQWRDVKSPIS